VALERVSQRSSLETPEEEEEESVEEVEEDEVGGRGGLPDEVGEGKGSVEEVGEDEGGSCSALRASQRSSLDAGGTVMVESRAMMWEGRRSEGEGGRRWYFFRTFLANRRTVLQR